MRKADEVVAVVCSDMHLSHKAPIARSAEPDWYDAMSRVLKQLDDLCEEHDCPLIIAGDVFDKWNSPAELINFAIERLPSHVYAIPGQHDLPYHNYDLKKKSAYYSLVLANKISDFNGTYRILDGNVCVSGFGWNQDFDPIVLKENYKYTHIAIIHSYIWEEGHGHPGASEDGLAYKWEDMLDAAGYKGACTGDNHRGFYSSGCVFNCGTLFRRKVDEVTYKPRVALIHGDGLWDAHYLDVSEDKFIDLEQAMSMVERGVELGDFLGELASLGEGGVNFFEAVKQFLNDNGISKRIKRRVLQALEKEK